MLTSTPVFEHLVISAAGRMALMRTIDPAVFVSFKRWMAANAQSRPEPKRRRDVRQADVVEGLLREGLVLTRVPAAALVAGDKPPNTGKFEYDPHFPD